jgi:tRNA uridine 5-carboxymethylaminomethyl modification enzyme
LLRQDNADLRLTEIGYRLGLVQETQYGRVQRKRDRIQRELARLRSTRLEAPLRQRLVADGNVNLAPDMTLEQLLRRPGLDYTQLLALMGIPTDDITQDVEITVKYSGYIRRQLRQVAGFKKLEGKQIPTTFDYDRVPGFSHEVREKLKKVRPASIGQASRIAGVTPAAVSLLLVAVERDRRRGSEPVVA